MVYPETFKAVGVVDFDDWLHPKSFEYKPQEFRDYDVDIEIEACGVCGSDIHAANGDWGRPYAPVAVGHEIIGKVVKVGPKAKEGIKVGDRVGVGAQCDCDNTCIACKKNLQSNCRNHVGTYFGVNKETGFKTIGGNASHIRVNSQFVFNIPDSLKTEHAAPLLCGGITGFSPLLQHNVGKGTKVGVVGIGGIGHMTILFAKALGAEVTAISRTDSKKEVAKQLGADHFAATADEDFIEKYADTLDLIVNTGSSFSGSSLDKLLSMLVPRGKFVFITAPPVGENIELSPMKLLFNNSSIQGSAIGSPEEIQYMLNFAAEHKIEPWVETIDISEENLGKAWKRAEEGDVKFRFTMVGYDKFFKN
ncbi:putative NADP-dependent alcohol dehydrogenase [Clavispora lusitaniae]|uniref:Enoyl reductase (ER) domain-containing protein n=2 Tax=Clavispora lusitaniae TaxID=36911 RepID=C4Y4W5_CLAL4|nr:uncharacterized protein CLUG_03199 [Clavispora lusitaniae ATCC 42720]QFZ27984.1 putative NADP-dependent alcohol dehydrogenase [Clavispora lusitaniae]EEQ39071.1 hypothetical protein CLUG_03199 [Clavispora lusitaniae ATCC 42720]QFZ33648.1 putative NADP-dependent alcohol dehydrogenase [Clavispora lusitaniae]QFZ39319.1 putative NADP-dependent alcohol dehydrogenase [Clavispora lusitaniae]QFZ45001.1 putative NADP-dependent alcohol dehydrogenase [Clavispora lusitaniae]